MIYHNYSPYYYGTPTNLNRKYSNNAPQYLNNNNYYAPKSYNKNEYTASSYSQNAAYSTPSYNNKQQKNFQKNIKRNNHNSFNANPQSIRENDERTINQKDISHKSNDDTVFEIFGIKLFFDDILLICLIFFLYNEGVQDQYLFISLVLLLLS